ncbi:protein Mpv17-like [Pollicipes pollicipes]|uniref:protein Mpv17-like n=1 Tax=Pollicipes pollicipes TaxID=41117 RepID=UPI0018853382|nr:protein Mpv17-like [Pollicipes pollicipes]XP_037081161.1 protein Mpv17-like [Pollicipes pollicipes]XP_037081162.1 protein Mpv17-like [Pollicipes pollicipes]
MGSRLRTLYNSLLTRHPVIVQSVQAGALMGVGDVLAQAAVERRPLRELDLFRVGRFFGIGLCMVGPGLRLWYGALDRYVGSQGARIVVRKVALDQGVFAPLFLGNFLVVLGVLQGRDWQQIKRKMKDEYSDILFNNWKLWPAVQLVNFYCVPLHHQVLFVQTIAIFWNTYLAWKANSSEVKAVEPLT